jgi:hypothetical protein
VNVSNDIKKIKISPIKEFIVIAITFFLGCLNLLNVYLAGDDIHNSGYAGMSLILFSAAGFLFGFLRMRLLAVRIEKNGITFTDRNKFKYFLSLKNVIRTEIRKARRRYTAALIKEDGGFVDLKGFFILKSAQKFLEYLNISADRNADINSDSAFSSDVFVRAENGKFTFSWKDSYSGIYRFSLALLFSGIVLMTGSIFTADLSRGFPIILFFALVPWMIFLQFRFRKRNEKPSVMLGKDTFAYGKEIRGSFVSIKELDRKNLKSFRYSYDLTTAVQYLVAIYNDNAVRIALPGLSVADAIPMCKKLNEILNQE